MECVLTTSRDAQCGKVKIDINIPHRENTWDVHDFKGPLYRASTDADTQLSQQPEERRKWLLFEVFADALTYCLPTKLPESIRSIWLGQGFRLPAKVMFATGNESRFNISIRCELGLQPESKTAFLVVLPPARNERFLPSGAHLSQPQYTN